MRIYMKRVVGLAVFVIMIAAGSTGFSQEHKCGFDKTIHAVMDRYPAFADSFETVRNAVDMASAKGTALIDTPVIPVVFHVILNQGQMVTIGDTLGIIQRINSQIEALNRDFNAANTDAIKIPGGFKERYGNANIRFALAHTKPDGTATPGYEIIVTTKNGFNIEKEWGSGFGFSGAKYQQGGGANAWDSESYLNVWIINTLENNSATNILGLAIPAYLATDEYGISPVEKGIIVHYAAFGVRKNPFEAFAKGSDMGRTLVHETGHYFDLLHIWGDDEGKCPFTGGADDGIDDTPLQSYPSSGCYTYPKYDGCTKTGDGIMFMNYMDYSSDTCLLMFTHGQVGRMRSLLKPGSSAYSLTQQPWLLQYPDATKPAAQNDFIVYPNPADDVLNIVFRKEAQGLNHIQLVDMLGRIIETKEYELQSLFYSFTVANLYTGMYFVVMHFDSGREVRKVLVR